MGMLFTAGLPLYFWGVYGALLSAVTYQSVVLLVTIVLCSRSFWWRKENFIGKFSGLAGKRLAHYSLMSLVSAATVPVSQLLVRSYMVKAYLISRCRNLGRNESYFRHVLNGLLPHL